ncbi:hypothetical protein [Xanthomonas albilineans]|nr:hypothetical protein [Xanthomonas albilineans]
MNFKGGGQSLGSSKLAAGQVCLLHLSTGDLLQHVPWGSLKCRRNLPIQGKGKLMEIKTSTMLNIVLVGGLLAGANEAHACCPGGIHHAPPAPTVGLGESLPNARNLSLDPALSIYEFQRDGVAYLQINDLTGNVRAVVGNVSGALWVLPMGADVSRVSLPTKQSEAKDALLVGQTSAFTVRVIPDSRGNKWEIMAAD